MSNLRLFGSTSNLMRWTVKDKTTGQGKTGLTGSTAGLIISTICDNEAVPTVYTQAANHIQTIAALGTYAAPSASNCRFAEVDSTNHKGLYEFQFADARYAVANAKILVVSINDAEATILDGDYEVELVRFNPFDAANLGLSTLLTLVGLAGGGWKSTATSNGTLTTLIDTALATGAPGGNPVSSLLNKTIVFTSQNNFLHAAQITTHAEGDTTIVFANQPAAHNTATADGYIVI